MEATHRTLTGNWVGANGFRMMPTDEFDEAPASATVATAAGGSALVLSYTWVHPADGPQDGLLLVGSPEDGQQAVTAAWSDSWHQRPALLLLDGTVDDRRLELAADYGGGFRWTITIEGSDDSLLVTMHNVVPDEYGTDDSPAGPYPVMVAALHRAG